MQTQITPGPRGKLLRVGIALFALAALLTWVNCALLPFARACYGVRLPIEAIGFAAALLFSLLLGRLTRGREARLYRLLCPLWLALFCIVGATLGHWMEYTPLGDNFMLYNGSEMLALEGSFASNPDFGLYLARFSNQWGMLQMMTLLRRLLLGIGVTAAFWPMAMFQTALHALGYGLLLRAVRRRSGDAVALRLLLSLALFPPVYWATANLYTDTFCLPFVAAGFAFALPCMDGPGKAEHPCRAALLCGIAAGLGAQVKMTALILPIACCIVFLLRYPLRRGIALSALALVPSLLLTLLVHGATLGTAVDPAVYAQQKTPILHWIEMSIPTSDNPYGGYRWADYDETWRLTDAGASQEELRASLLARMKDKIYTLRFPNRLLLALARKDAAIAGDGTFGMTEMLDDRPVRPNALSAWVLEGGAHYPFYLSFMAGLWLFHLARAALFALVALKHRDETHALAMVALFGILLFLMGWEARSRYLFAFLPLFLALSAEVPSFQKSHKISR